MKENDEKLTTEYFDMPADDVSETAATGDENVENKLDVENAENVENAEIAGEAALEPQAADAAECEEKSDAERKNDAAVEKPESPKKKRVMRILRNVFLVAVIAIGILSLIWVLVRRGAARREPVVLRSARGGHIGGHGARRVQVLHNIQNGDGQIPFRHFGKNKLHRQVLRRRYAVCDGRSADADILSQQ